MVAGETAPVLQPMVVWEQLAELLRFSFSCNHDGGDVCFLLVPFFVDLSRDMVFVQTRKHQRTIKPK